MGSPMCDVFEAQVRLYPDAKVVLTEHPKGRFDMELETSYYYLLVELIAILCSKMLVPEEI